MVRMLQMFCKNIPPGIDHLKDAANAGDYSEMQKVAHKLKTMFRYVGVDQVAEYLEKLEFRSHELSDAERNNLLTHINTASQRAIIEAQDVILTTPV